MPLTLNKNRVRRQLLGFEFSRLFIEELGWDHGGRDIEVPIANNSFCLKAIAHKRGMVAFHCNVKSESEIPDYPTRQKIEKVVVRTNRENLIIFTSLDQINQYWQWVKRELGQPDRTRQHIFHQGQSGASIIQKLEHIAFTLEEEEDLSIVDVSGRVKAAFDVSRITRKFYDEYQDEHKNFMNFIEGIKSISDKNWYASLMLNRMMFIYFIQKRGFLDNDIDYLRSRLIRLQKTRGKNQFQSFYRVFLLRLFHEGLNKPESQRSSELHDLLGKIPYLNGGLFDIHDLETHHKKINIPDEAFLKVFEFFDSYQWHLDERPLRNDNEINPDVLGYIFERYINQKQQGAYYTKEDVTGYISRNSIIPFLFDQIRKECPSAFKQDSDMWSLLSSDPDRYFYDAILHGISSDHVKNQHSNNHQTLPENIFAGIADVSLQTSWNEVASEEYGLPKETWREHIARRRKFNKIRELLATGAISEIDDLISLNLDIEKFAQDAISRSESPEFIFSVWKAIKNISILDPTCGSGAFLFAALNILYPIYVACIESIRGLLNDVEKSMYEIDPEIVNSFKDIELDISRHINESYFVLKSIIMNNLYGVDIMEEAVEICKLRLFLKLVAQLEEYEQIEPLPDIDFNVRSGNALVGFTSYEAVKNALESELIRPVTLPEIIEQAESASNKFQVYRELQVNHAENTEVLEIAKSELRHKLNELCFILDQFLAESYGINEEKKFGEWRASHQPFHWFTEFYQIMHDGGFDVIIGNPPYIAKNKVLKTYAVKGYSTISCPDIYAWTLERSLNLLKETGRSGMIVPLSLGFSKYFHSCRRMLFSEYSRNWFSSFGRIPAGLFTFDTRIRNTIHMGFKSKESNKQCFTTRLHRWFSVQRPTLFDALEYVPFRPELWTESVPKLNTAQLAQAFENLYETQNRSLNYSICLCI